MNSIRIADITMSEASPEQAGTLNFKEKVELVKQLDKIQTNVIELNEISSEATDILFYKTVAPIVKNSVLSCPAGLDTKKTEKAYGALSEAKNKRINVTVPLSAVGMEYFCGKKPEKMPELIGELVAHAHTLCENVEFTAEDALRSEVPFLCEAVAAAIKAGASTICICDSAGSSLPEEISAIINEIRENALKGTKAKLALKANNAFGLAPANIFAAIKAGVSELKTSLYGSSTISIESAVNVLSAKGESCGVKIGIDTTRLKRTVAQLKRHSGAQEQNHAATYEWQQENKLELNENSSIAEVSGAVSSLGYELSPEDKAKVYEAFKHIAKAKKVGAKELDAIVATEAMQVPQTYRLISYVINSSNIFTTTANIALEKNGVKTDGLCAGDGSVDAAFMAIEKIAGRHFELDDFQLQAVTEGREAIGEALVRLRHNGTLYSGKGASTDIVGASIKAYVSALNKIAYEENIK